MTKATIGPGAQRRQSTYRMRRSAEKHAPPIPVPGAQHTPDSGRTSKSPIATLNGNRSR